MRKSIKILLSSFLAASQLSYCVPSIYATSGKSKSSSQQSTVLTYAKNAVLLPIKGAWWLAKANLKAAAVVIGDLTVLAGAGYCLYKAGVIEKNTMAIIEDSNNLKNINMQNVRTLLALAANNKLDSERLEALVS